MLVLGTLGPVPLLLRSSLVNLRSILPPGSRSQGIFTLGGAPVPLTVQVTLYKSLAHSQTQFHPAQYGGDDRLRLKVQRGSFLYMVGHSSIKSVFHVAVP